VDNYVQARARHDTGKACKKCGKWKKNSSGLLMSHRCTRYTVVSFRECFTTANAQEAALALRRLNATVLDFILKNERRGPTVEHEYRPEFDYSVWKPCPSMPFDLIGRPTTKPKTRKKKTLTRATRGV